MAGDKYRVYDTSGNNRAFNGGCMIACVCTPLPNSAVGPVSMFVYDEASASTRAYTVEMSVNAYFSVCIWLSKATISCVRLLFSSVWPGEDSHEIKLLKSK